MPTLVWRGLDAPRMEIARAEVDGGSLRADGTQIGVAYELRYELEPGRLRAHVIGGRSIDIGLDGADFFDLGYSPLFNSLPVLAGLDGAADFVMSWVDVPSLDVKRSEQVYEPLGRGTVRFSSGSFTADIEFDDDRFVTRYPGLAERVS
ncbi:MAG TPA: putative glycolipid-binding domain-containing protein [Gaiellaceae bacterium]|nr:putative glycolipid-binding domain-containing protein [Gaiellaceae bacterium]